MRRLVIILLAFHYSLLTSFAQVGEFRKDLAIGVNGGYVLSNVDFMPKVPQGFHGIPVVP